MANTGGGRNSCSIVCAIAGAVMALIILVLTRQSEGLFVAILLAALVGLAFWWMLSTFLCVPGEAKPAKKAAPAVEASAPPASAEVVEAADSATSGDDAGGAEAAPSGAADAAVESDGAEPVTSDGAAETVEAPVASEPEAATADAGASQDGGAQDYDGDGVIEGADEGVKPTILEGPRDGAPDDLKKIKGVGPKLESVLHGLGFYHFDQIASWSADEVAWVDANLEGFRGRVSRDEWVSQAKLLAAGEATEFSKKVDKGGVY